MSNIEQLKLTFDAQLYLMSSEDIREFANNLPDDNQGAIEEFCSWFDMESWYQEALELNNPGVREWLLEAADTAAEEEAVINEDDRIADQSLKSSQGWKY